VGMLIKTWTASTPICCIKCFFRLFYLCIVSQLCNLINEVSLLTREREKEKGGSRFSNLTLLPNDVSASHIGACTLILPVDDS